MARSARTETTGVSPEDSRRHAGDHVIPPAVSFYRGGTLVTGKSSGGPGPRSREAVLCILPAYGMSDRGASVADQKEVINLEVTQDQRQGGIGSVQGPEGRADKQALKDRRRKRAEPTGSPKG
jgi:hypothetical protein